MEELLAGLFLKVSAMQQLVVGSTSESNYAQASLFSLALQPLAQLLQPQVTSPGKPYSCAKESNITSINILMWNAHNSFSLNI